MGESSEHEGPLPHTGGAPDFLTDGVRAEQALRESEERFRAEPVK